MKLKPDSRENTLFLVDVSSFIFRAFFAIRHLSSKSGEPTNAVYGVGSMVAKVIEDSNPKYLTIVYDSKEPSFRKEVYPEYKANRSETPDDLIPQFDRIEELLAKMKLNSIRKSGVEADDLIGTLTHRWIAENPKHEVVIVTGDKDLMQLVTPRVRVWDTMKGVDFGPAEVEAKFGVRPDQVRDYLALVGDTSDNIPGVPSIGPKGAVDLLKEFGTLKGVVDAAKAGKIKGKKGETIAANEKDAYLSQELATLMDVKEAKADLHAMLSPFADGVVSVGPECLALLEELDLRSLRDKWNKGAPSTGAHATTGQTSTSANEKNAEFDFSDASSSGGARTDSGGRTASGPTFATANGFVPSIPSTPISGARLVVTPETFESVLTEKQLIHVLDELAKVTEFGFDLETTSLNPREAHLVGIAIAPTTEKAYYIPVGHRGSNIEQLPEKFVLDHLRPILLDPRKKKVGHNLKYDFSVLAEMGILADGIGADTMIADYVLDPEGRHNLETVAGKRLGFQTMTYESVCGKGKDQVPFDLIPIDVATRYSAEDAWIALNLWKEMQPRIQSQGLMRIFAEIDLPLVQIIGKMERTGVSIDADYLKKVAVEFKKDIDAVDEKIQKFAQGPLNLNSPKQLGELLFNQLKLPPQGKTKTGFSTDASVLEALAPLHEVPRLILQHREIAKLMGTYVEPLPTMRDAKTGKIHAGFHQTVAATGRLSSSDPNLQNIPVRSERGQKIRRAFIPSKGNVLLSADYSQIELRILAQMSGDKDLIGSFQRDEDVHRRTASEIFGVKPEEVTDKQRSAAKAINFGLMYGKSAFALAAELEISRTEAKDIIAKYFARYSGVKTFLDGLILGAKERGESSTLLGRKRELRDINAKNPAVRAGAERMAMNTPIQGTAADLMKLAMIRIDEELTKQKLAAKLIIQVHDEFVLDVPLAEVEKVKALVVHAMEHAFDGVVKLDIPLKVNVETGPTWADL
jgi:DNA polymerase-1